VNFIRRTINLALANVEQGGRPFACLIVKDGRSSPRGSIFYEEISLPWDRRQLPMFHEPHREGIGVYRRWRELNG
jgi:hypothetical protein